MNSSHPLFLRVTEKSGKVGDFVLWEKWTPYKGHFCSLLIHRLVVSNMILAQCAGCCRRQEETGRVFYAQLLRSGLLRHGRWLQEAWRRDCEVSKTRSESLVLLGIASQYLRECCNYDKGNLYVSQVRERMLGIVSIDAELCFNVLLLSITVTLYDMIQYNTIYFCALKSWRDGQHNLVHGTETKNKEILIKTK